MHRIKLICLLPQYHQLRIAEWSTIVSQNKIALPANQQDSDPNFPLQAMAAQSLDDTQILSMSDD
ncbi:hypothetical protein NC652_009752 [Populus alba x Populus x berolinensis]|nr:hypothetical protein NC652_009752 [Populus alba x Populus x berolinensis]